MAGIAAPRRPSPLGSWAVKLLRLLPTTNGNSTTLRTIISENNDLAAKNPDKLKELQELFMAEAQKIPGASAG